MFSSPELPDDFPARMDASLRARGLNFTEFAILMDVAPSTAARWLNGSGRPNKPSLEKIIIVLGADSEPFLTGKSSKPPVVVVKS